MPTVNIPVTTLQPNQVVNTGPQSLAGVTSYLLTVNRNAGADSLDSNPTASFTFEVDESMDGGNTWQTVQTATAVGGVLTFTNKQGQQVTVEQSEFGSTFDPGADTGRAIVTNGDVRVSISGSLTLT